MDEVNQPAMPPQSPDQLHSSFENSGSSKVIPFIIVAVLLVLVGVGSYILGTKKSQPTTENKVVAQPSPTSFPTPTPDPTADWTIYTNPTYGYSIKFPNIYEVPPQTEREKSQLGVDQYRCITNKTTGTCRIAIDFWQKSLDDVVKIKAATDNSQTQDYIVNNIKGKIIVYKIGQSTTQAIVIISKPASQDKTITLTYSNYPGDVKTSEIINQIIQTFKFTP